MVDQPVPTDAERRTGTDRRQGDRRQGDRRARHASPGVISLSGDSHLAHQPGFFDHTWLVMGAISAGIAIGLGVMLLTDSSRFSHPDTDDTPRPAVHATVAAPAPTPSDTEFVIKPQ